MPSQNPRKVLQTTLPLYGVNGTYQLPLYKMFTGYDRSFECKNVNHPKRVFSKYEIVGKGRVRFFRLLLKANIALKENLDIYFFLQSFYPDYQTSISLSSQLQLKKIKDMFLNYSKCFLCQKCIHRGIYCPYNGLNGSTSRFV